MPKTPPTDQDLENLAANLRIAMREKHYSQLDLAGIAKVQQSLISRILSGKNDPCLSAIRRIAKALSVRIDDLLDPPPRRKLRNAS